MSVGWLAFDYSKSFQKILEMEFKMFNTLLYISKCFEKYHTDLIGWLISPTYSIWT